MRATLGYPASMEQWIQQFWSELDHLGEEEVRLRLANQSYGHNGREELVREWLQKKQIDRAAEAALRRAEKDTAQMETSARVIAAIDRAVKTAEQSASASERSASASEKSNTRASIAIMLAATALIVSILSLLAHFLK